MLAPQVREFRLLVRIDDGMSCVAVSVGEETGTHEQGRDPITEADLDGVGRSFPLHPLAQRLALSRTDGDWEQRAERSVGRGRDLAVPEAAIDHLIDLHVNKDAFLAKSDQIASRRRKPFAAPASFFADGADPDPASEGMAEKPTKPRKKEPEPPGEFLSEDLRDATTRFLDEVKRQIEQRKEARPEPKLGPPNRQKR
jgi:hypothetical protein